MSSRLSRSEFHQSIGALASQGLSSASNLLASVLAVRSLPIDGYGRFAMVLLGAQVALGIVRAGVSESWVIKGRDSGAASLLIGANYASSLAASAVAVFAGIISGGQWRAPLFALAVVFPLVSLHDAYRYRYIKEGRSGSAVSLDLAWTMLLFVALILDLPSRVTAVSNGAARMITVWGIGAAIAILSAIALDRKRHSADIAGGIRWMSQHRGFVAALGLDFLIATVAGYSAFLVVTSVRGPEPVALFEASMLPFRPLLTLASGCALIFVGILRERMSSFTVRTAGVVAAAFAAVGVGWYLIVTAGGATIGRLLVGETWSEVEGLVGLQALSATVAAFATAMAGVIRAKGAAGWIAKARMSLGPVAVGVPVTGGILGGSSGLVIGVVGSRLLAGTVFGYGAGRGYQR